MECPACYSNKLISDLEGIHCVNCGFNIRTKENETRENSRPSDSKDEQD